MIEKLKNGMKNAVSKGFFHILGGNTLVKFISLFSALLLPRLLTKEEFGQLAYVDNMYSYLLLVNGLGINAAILRFVAVAQDEAEKKEVFKYSLKFGIMADFVICILMSIVLFFMRVPLDGVKKYLFFIIFLPIPILAFECISSYLRSNFQNKKYSLLSIAYTLMSALLQVAFAWKFKIFGAITARYITAFAAVAFGMLLIGGSHFSFRKTEDRQRKILDKAYRRNIFKFAFAALAASGFSLILPLNEQMVLTQIFKSETMTANYRASSLGAQNIQIITMSVVVFIYPYFARHTNDGKWLWKSYKKVASGLLAGVGALSVAAYFLTPYLVPLIFGEKYRDIIGLMSFMWLTFGINAVVRMPVGNILASVGEVKFNLINAFASSLVHIILDIIFIKKMGINGAAIALTITYLLSGVAGVVYFKGFCKRKVQINE